MAKARAYREGCAGSARHRPCWGSCSPCRRARPSWRRRAVGARGRRHRGAGRHDAGPTDDVVELWTSLGDDAAAVARAAEGFPARWRWKVIELDPSVTETWRAHAHAVVDREGPRRRARRGCRSRTLPARRSCASSPVPRSASGITRPRCCASERCGPRCRRGLGCSTSGCGSGVLAVAAAVLGAATGHRHRHLPGDARRRRGQRRGQRRGGRGSRCRPPRWPRSTGPSTWSWPTSWPRRCWPWPTISSGSSLPTARSSISGLLADRSEHVVAALAPLRPVERRTKEGWTAITLRH